MKSAVVAKTLLGAAVLGAGIGGATAAVFWDDEVGTSDVASRQVIDEPEPSRTTSADVEALDYNCSLPGQGFPWLERVLTRDGQRAMHSDLGIFRSTLASSTYWEMHLPVPLYGGEPKMSEVYDMLCKVHPSFSEETDLRPLSQADLNVLAETWEELDLEDDGWTWFADTDSGIIYTEVNFEGVYTDGLPRGEGEAHLRFEPIRLYFLPPITQEMVDLLSAGPGDEPENERFHVQLIANECLDYAHGVPGERRAVCFEVDVTVDLTARWRDGQVEGVTGTVIAAAIIVEQDFQPEETWRLRYEDPSCPRCESWELEPEVQVEWLAQDERVLVSWPDPTVENSPLELTATVEYLASSDGTNDVWDSLMFKTGPIFAGQEVPLTLWDSGPNSWGPQMFDVTGPVSSGEVTYRVTPLP